MRNRLLYHTGRRLLQALLFAAGILAAAGIFVVSVSLSELYLGSVLPAAISYLVVLLTICAWILAKDDVERERRERDRVLERLSRD